MVLFVWICEKMGRVQNTMKNYKRLFRKKLMFPPPTPNPTRVVILLGDTSSRPVLHFYQVSSKYYEGYRSCKADTKSYFNTRREDKSKSKKPRVVILVPNISSHPVLHFYQVSSKYSKGYSCCRADKISNSNKKGR